MKNATRLLIGAQLLLALAYTLPLFSSELLRKSDFVSFYTGWSMVRDGEGARLYDVELQRTYEAGLWTSGSPPPPLRLLPFVNPPPAAVTFTPFSYFSFGIAAYVFLALNCLVAVWVLRRLWQLTAGWERPARILLITTILGTEVLWYGLATRTITLIVFACLIEYYRSLKEGRDACAAVSLIAGAFKPQLIFLTAFIPIILRRWRVVLIAASLGGLIVLGISRGFGFHIWPDYLRLLREVSANGEMYGAFPLQMNNLRMFLYRIAPSGAVVPLVYAGLIIGMVGVFWLWRSARGFELKFAVTLLLGLFLAPHLNYQDTLVVFLPAVIIYDWAREKDELVVKVLQSLIVIATLLPPILIFSGNRTLRWIWPVAFILILIALGVRALRSEQFGAAN